MLLLEVDELGVSNKGGVNPCTLADDTPEPASLGGTDALGGMLDLASLGGKV